MTEENWIKNLSTKLQSLLGRAAKQEAVAAVEEDELCCNGRVHIAYRGISDDRMYLVRDRQWREVRYFKQNGLRVFCADCRRRLL